MKTIAKKACSLGMKLLGVAAVLMITAPPPASAQQAIGGLRIERTGHTATRLPNGKILVVGGENASGPVRDSEIFDPASRAFTPATGLLTARADHSATRLPDGRLLVIGGRAGSQLLDSTEFYDPEAGVFSSGPTLNHARAGHTATLLLDGRIAVIGGDADGSVELLDPAVGVFRLIEPRLAVARKYHAAALLRNGDLLIAGGVSSSGAVLNSAELLDTADFTFLPISPAMCAARSRPTLRVLPDGKVQVIGGDAGGTMELFNADGGYFTALGHPAGNPDLLSAALRTQTRAAVIGGLGPRKLTSANPDLVSAADEVLDRSGYSLTEIPERNEALVTGGTKTSGKLTTSSALFATSSATVTTDKTDYAPGETVVVTGTGWQPGETVNLNFHRDTGVPPDTLLTAIADANGNIQNSQYVVQQTDLGLTFLLTATGQTSGYTAQTTFTDGNASNGDGTMAVSPTSVTAGSTGNTLTFTFASPNGKDFNAGSQATILVPAGWTAPTSSNVTVASGPSHNCTAATLGTITGTGPWTIPINMTCPGGDSFTAAYSSVTAPATAGANTFTTQTKQNGGTLTNIATQPVVTVQGTTSTAVVSSNNPQTYGQSVTLTATVTSGTGTPTTGTVTFKDGASNITGCTNPASVNSSGVATCTTSALPAGSRSITAVYNGDVSTPPIFTGSTSPVLNQTINQKALTVTGITANNKTYDGTTAATLNTGSAALVGVVAGDTVALNTAGATGAFADKNVGNGKTVTVSGLTISGASAGNYTLTQPTTTANITAKALTVTGITADSKVYDGNTTATIHTGSAALVGVVAPDVVTLNTGSATGTFATKTAGTAKTVTVSGLTISGADSSNYTLTQPTTTADITAKGLTVTGITANNKVYDGSTTATLNTAGTVLAGVVSGDTVNLVTTGATGTFADKNVGNGKTVTVAGLTLSGADAANYTVTQPTTTANITSKALTVSGVTANNKVYDGTATATLNTGSAALVGVVSGETVTLSTAGATGAFADKNVGTGKTVTISGLTISGASAGNYTLTQPTTTANITPKALAVTGITAASKVYDGTTVATLNTASAVLGGVVSGDVVTLSTAGAAGAFASASVGTGKTVTVSGLAISGADAGNYSLTQPTTTADITAKPLTVTGITANNKVYNGNTTATLNTGSAALVGAVSGDNVNLNTTGATGAFADKNVGTGKTVTVSGLALGGNDKINYTLTQPTTTADITPKALTVSGVTANNKVYDGDTSATLNTSGAALVGVVSGDSVTLNTGGATAVFADKTVGTGKTVTISGLAIGGTDAGNYTLTQPTTTASITARPLTVAGITANSKVYDGNTVATLNTGSAALVGVVAGDTVTLNTGSATGAFADKNVGTGKTVTVSGLTIGGTDASNYALTQPTATADITAKNLTVSGITANNKVYDGNTTATLNLGGAALVGVVSGDAVTLSTAGATGTFDSPDVGTGKTVTIAGLTISGADAGNYTLTQPTTTANITKAALTVTGITANDKIYDATTAATLNTSLAALVGVLDSDDVHLDASGAVGTFDTKDAGPAKTVTVSGLALTGTKASDYSLTQPTATAAITPKALTYSGLSVPTSKVYDGTTDAVVSGTAALPTAEAAGAGTTADGKPYTGDTVSLTGTPTGTYNSKTVAGATTVTFGGLSLKGAQADDYTLTASTQAATITPKALTASYTGVDKVYDRTVSASVTGGTLSGIVGTDSVSLTGTASATFASKNVPGGAVTVTGVSLSGADEGNYSLSTPITTAAAITPRALTVSATGVSRTYDGTTAATVTLSDNRVSGDVFTDSYGSASFADKNVGTGKTVSVSGITISGTDAGNYSFNMTASTTANITPRSLTVTATGVNKTYDGTTAATVNLSDNRVSGDVFTDSYTSAGFANKNVGAGKTVSVSGISISGTDSGNYSLSNTTVSTTADITGRPLTISAVGVNKVYDGTMAATVGLADNRVSGDVFTDSYAAASFADKNVGTGIAVSVTGISISGTDAGNYTFNTTAAATADITPKSLTATITAANKTYDGNTNATMTGCTLSGVVSPDSVSCTASNGHFSDASAGTGKTVTADVALSGADAHNYSVAATATTHADITKATLTVSGVTVNDRIYDGTTVASLNLGSAALVGVINHDDVTLQTGAAVGTFDTKDVGSPKTVTVSGLTITGAQAGDYELTQPTATAAITPKALTYSGLSVPASRVYDGDTTAVVSGTAALQTAEAAPGTPSDGTPYTGDAVSLTGTPTGTYNSKTVAGANLVTFGGLSLTGAQAGDYSLTASTQLATITPKTLTASYTGVDKVYDGTTSASVTGGTLSGIVGTDSVSLTGPPSSTFASKNVPGGTVTVTGVSLTGTDAGNYTLYTPITTSASITPRALTVTATGVNRTYDGTTAATVTLSDNRVSGDIFTDSYSSASFADKNVGTGKAVSVSGISISGMDAGNYTFNTTASATANITPRSLTVTAAGVNKVYDGNTSATVTLSDNRVSGDVLTDSYTSASFANKNVGTGKAVSVSGISISGTDAGNYSLSNTTASATADITGRPLTISAVGNNKVYDGTTTATVSLSDNRVAGDVFTDSYTSATFLDKTVGTGKAVNVSGISISGTDAGNYTFNTTTSTTADITGRSLTISATGLDKVYDGTTMATVSLLDNRVSGDVFTDTYTSASFANKNVGSGKTVSVSGISISGPDAGNYTFNTTAAATANITPRALTVTATGVNKVYDGTTAATVTLSDNRVSGDVFADSYTSASFATKAEGTGKAISVSGISISGTDAGNYTFNTTASTTADITGRPLTISATGVNKVYDGTTAATVTLSDNRVSGDALTDSYTSAAFADKNVGAGKPVSVSGISISGTDAGNYTFNTTASTTASITALALTVTATGINKIYDGMTTATVTLADNRVSGDVFTDGYTSAAFADPNVGNTKPVSVSGISISGTDAGNYTFNTAAMTTASITQASTTTKVTGSPIAFSGIGQSVLLTATVSPLTTTTTTPTGSVTFMDGANPLGTVAVSLSGVATYSAALAAGSHTINASYTGDTNYATSKSSAPAIGSVAGPAGPLSAPASGSSTTVTVAFTDTTTDTHTCSFSWDDSSITTPVTPSGTSCTATHSFPSSGVYTIGVTVADDNGGFATSVFQFIVVYDPGAGFVTGGGWIMSPAGASSLYPLATGKANFGFVSKYQKGANVPTGETEFQFQAGNFDFHSTAYQWLVVSGAKAQYKGTGTVNGAGTYGFLLTATDGALNGGGGVDQFRIKVWDTGTSTVIYDNAPGSDDINTSNQTALGGGSIVIHK